MSNAMRFGKRTLAGVAAGALALGALTIASAPAASAKPSIKPKASVTATVNAVRATVQGTSTLALPYASMGWSGTSTLSSTSTIDLTTAPTAASAITWTKAGVSDDSVALNDAPKAVGANALATGLTTNVPTGYEAVDDSSFYFNVNVAGLYAGMIYNGTDTVSFSFTTAGVPASISLTPATQTVLVGAQADLKVTLLDSAGKPTQPQTVDSIALTRSPTDDTLTALDTLSPAITGLTNTQLSTGVGAFSLSTGSTAGSTTVTATPAGTLASTGVTAQTATVVKSGTVASNSVANLTVSTPANAVNVGTIAGTNRAAQIQAPSSNVVVTVDDTTSASAGNKVRFAVWTVPAGGLVNGGATSSTAPAYFDLTTDASKKATLPLTLGGTALNVNAQIVVQQVNVRDVATTVPTTALTTITQTQALVQPNSIVPTPTAALAKLGASTTVTVQVDDSFGADQVGWTVRAYRGSATGTLLSTAVTNASGQATVTVSPVSTLTSGSNEVYYYTATPPVGTGTVTASATTTVIYTSDGNITSMTVTPATGNAFSNTSSTVTTAPVTFVPDDTAGVVYGQSAGVVTLSTNVNSTAPTGMFTTFTPAPNLATVVTATVTEASGLRVSATAPGATTLWSGGNTTATLTGNGTNAFYVWGTKTGTHDIVFTSGGINLTGKVKVTNRAQDAYNISITPDKANVARGGFTTLTAKVTDFWGNPVATTAGAITGTATGEVLLGGNTNTATFGTNAAGEASITVIAANSAGAGTVTLTPTTAGAPPAWAVGYTKPASFTTAPTLTAVSLITVGEAPATKSITITGARTTVSGKSGIAVDGITVGIENGKTVTPFIRFPGETTFTAGSARPAINNDEVTWQRKTGKRVTVYLELSDDATIKSNRVVIQAN